MAIWERGQQVGGRDYTRAQGNLEAMSMFITLTVVMIFQMYTYDQNCHTVHFKYIQFIEYQFIPP